MTNAGAISLVLAGLACSPAPAFTYELTTTRGLLGPELSNTTVTINGQAGPLYVETFLDYESAVGTAIDVTVIVGEARGNAKFTIR